MSTTRCTTPIFGDYRTKQHSALRLFTGMVTTFSGRNLGRQICVVVADQPHDKDMLIAYLGAIRIKAKSTVDGETESTLARRSGFSWLDFTRLESHLCNLRHLQHHCGQLAAVLRRQEGEGVKWVPSESL